MPLLACPHYYCAKFMTVRCNQTYPSRTVCALLFTSLKKHLNSDHIAMQSKMVRNVFPNHQIRNNMFHSDRNSEQNSPKWPIWEQCVPLKDRNSDQNSPNLPIWEQCVPLKDIRTRNKTVLNDQFGNSVFHS